MPRACLKTRPVRAPGLQEARFQMDPVGRVPSRGGSARAFKQALGSFICAVLMASIIGAAGCHAKSGNTPTPKRTMPTRDINTVLRDHDKKLMAIPGVVGVFVGVLPDGETPCLKVMAATRTPALESRVPKSLEGYPVIIEETGVIRPL